MSGPWIAALTPEQIEAYLAANTKPKVNVPYRLHCAECEVTWNPHLDGNECWNCGQSGSPGDVPFRSRQKEQ